MPQFSQEVADVVAVPGLAASLPLVYGDVAELLLPGRFTDDRRRGFVRSPGTLL